MHINKKLALIGIHGGILLAATSALTLTSQASNISSQTNNNDRTISPSQNNLGQGEQKFDDSYHQAQQRHWQTGHWGTAKFYVNSQCTMHVGSGRLHNSYTKVVNMNQVRAISLNGKVQAPRNSRNLFSSTGLDSNTSLQTIDHLDNLDTSQTTDMSDMFFSDESLHNLDVSHFDTHDATNMYEMFNDDSALKDLDLSHFDTANVGNMAEMFNDDSSLNSLDLSSFDTHNVENMSNMFGVDGIHRFILGSDTKLSNNTNLTDTYQQGTQDLSLNNNGAHPGTWVKP